MKLIITELAREDFNIISAYIKDAFGANSAKIFLEKISTVLDLISQNPKVGTLQFEDKQIRGFVAANKTQILYWIDEMNNTIFITSFFDVRQSPEKKI